MKPGDLLELSLQDRVLKKRVYQRTAQGSLDSSAEG